MCQGHAGSSQLVGMGLVGIGLVGIGVMVGIGVVGVGVMVGMWLVGIGVGAASWLASWSDNTCEMQSPAASSSAAAAVAVRYGLYSVPDSISDIARLAYGYIKGSWLCAYVIQDEYENISITLYIYIIYNMSRIVNMGAYSRGHDLCEAQVDPDPS